LELLSPLPLFLKGLLCDPGGIFTIGEQLDDVVGL
jgi:hypothetical protein